MLTAAREGISVKNSKAYITGDSCLECAKSLIKAGVTEWVVGNRGHVATEDNVAIRDYFIDWFNVKITKNEKVGLSEVKYCGVDVGTIWSYKDMPRMFLRLNEDGSISNWRSLENGGYWTVNTCWSIREVLTEEKKGTLVRVPKQRKCL